MSALIYPSSINKEYTRGQLEGIVTPPPLGAFHQPYSFSDFVDTIHNGLEIEGIEIISEEYVTSHEDLRLFGALELHIPVLEGEFIPAGGRDHKLILGFRGSHDQTVTRGLAIGSQVLVCSNLCFSGDLGNISTKQTTNIATRLPGAVRTALALIPEHAALNARRFDAYKNFNIERRQGDAALVEIYRQGGLSAPQLGKAIKEWDTPSHDDHAQFGYSAWQLFNACTEAIKPTGAQSNPNIIVDRSAKITAFLDSHIHF